MAEGNMFKKSSINLLMFLSFLFLSGYAMAIGSADGSQPEFTSNIVIDSNTVDRTIEDGADIKNFDEVVGDGGAVYSVADLVVGSGVTFELNIASGVSEQANGGAVYIKDSVLTIGDNSKFLTNKATGNGGAIYNSNSTINIGANVLFDGNVADSDSDNVGNGGAVYNERGRLNFGGDVIFSNNSAYDGGAVYTKVSLTLNNGVTFEGNNALNDGGAIYVGNTILSINSGTVFNTNTAAGNGGAVFNNVGIVSISSGTEFNGNSADMGGAIYNNTGTVNIYNGVIFNGNSAAEGGAVYSTGGNLNFYTSENAIEFQTASDSVYATGTTVNFNGMGEVDGSATSFTLDGGNLNLTGSTVKFDSVNLGDNTNVKLSIYRDGGVVKSGNIQARTLTLLSSPNPSDGMQLQFNIELGALNKFETGVIITVVDLSGADYSGWDEFANAYTIENNLYEITYIGNGQYQVDRTDTPTVDVVQAHGGNQHMVKTAVAWNDSADFITGTHAHTLANTLYGLAQNGTREEYLGALVAIAPSTSKLIYETTTERAGQIYRVISNRLGSSYAADKEYGEHYEGLWFEGIYNQS
ncbi:MAG: hypothetical protein LBR35_01810, partial [Rickettsiales bacterium]|nr:hypothetical protein [Rickettsiales bacterium]